MNYGTLPVHFTKNKSKKKKKTKQKKHLKNKNKKTNNNNNKANQKAVLRIVELLLKLFQDMF